MEIEIRKEAFCDPNLGIAPFQPKRTTRASSDHELVASWLGAFDPVDSRGTIKLYLRVVRGFLDWMDTRGLTLRSLTVEALTEWRDQLEGVPATRALKLAILRSLLTYGHKTGFLAFNVSSAVRSPKVAVDPDARSLTEMEVASMIHVARQALQTEEKRTTPRPRYVGAARQRLHLVLWLYYSASRVSEISNLKWEDLHHRIDGDYNISVLGKGSKRRTVPMPRRIVEEVSGGSSEERTGRIFPIGTRRIQTVIASLAQEAGLKSNPSPHWLRHASASHAVDRGASLPTVQQTLGHASLQTTGRYLHRGQNGSAQYLAEF